LWLCRSFDGFDYFAVHGCDAPLPPGYLTVSQHHQSPSNSLTHSILSSRSDPLDKNALVTPGVDLYTRVQSYWSREKATVDEILAFRPMDWDDRTTLLSVMSAANTIAIVLLAGVVLLQVSEWYVEESIAAEIEADRKKALGPAPVTEEKKKQ